MRCLDSMTIALALAAGACGDDGTSETLGGDTGGATSAGAPSTGQAGGDTTSAAPGTSGGVIGSCGDATTADACDAMQFCEWTPTTFVATDAMACGLDGAYGGVCIDYATADGCEIGFCGTGDFGGAFAIFYREVEGGYEIAKTTDCNPMTDDFEMCPFEGSAPAPAVCDCACYSAP